MPGDGLMLQPRPSVMSASQRFAMVPSANIERSTFDRSHGYKSTIDADKLYPILVDEMLPADTFSCGMSASLVALNPLRRPFQDNLFVEWFTFFTPTRLLWEHWAEFYGYKRNPDDSTVYTEPMMDTALNVFTAFSLGDYFGIPTGVPALPVRAAFFRAHNRIHNTWFRDQNFQDSVPDNIDDGPDAIADYDIYRRGRRKDYFTGALPSPQKGSAVTLPLGTTAPVVFPSSTIYGSDIQRASNGASWGVLQGIFSNLSSPGPASNLQSSISEGTPPGPETVDLRLLSTLPSNAYTDLASATSATINSIRTAFQVQVFLERDMRGGTRPPEKFRAHFGVVSPDARLQRPELLGMGSSRIMLTSIPQTSSTSGSNYQGQMTGYLNANLSGGGWTYSATEPGIILTYINIRADLTYQYGLDRMFSRTTQYDHYWPAFAHLGEQVVYNREIYAQGNGDDVLPWGYQERYGEYRYKPSRITGALRSNYATSLDIWHLAEELTALPVLGDPYIQSDTPLDRVLAVPSEPHFVLDVYFNYRCARPMPVYSIPGLTDHF